MFEDQIQVRSYKNELESYIKKYKESKLEFDVKAQQADIDKFCEKATALIECLLPPQPDDKNDEEQQQDELLQSDGSAAD